MVDCYPYFNDFPEDVQRLVFEFAFEVSRLMTCPLNKKDHAVRLALVSRRVNKWIEPLLYRVIHTSRIRGNPVRDSSQKPEDFFKNHVKYIFIDEIVSPEFMEDILSECHTNLVGLAWWQMAHDRLKWASFLLTQSFPSLRKMSIYYGAIFPSNVEAPFSEPIFKNLTHLDIGLPATDAHFTATSSNANLSKIASWKNLRGLEALIHLHLDMNRALSFRAPGVTGNFQEMILDVLSHLPHNVHYLSLHLPHTFLSKAAVLPTDSRQVYDDLIRGRTDPRILVCYGPSKRWDLRSRQMVENFISVEGFSEYLLAHNAAQEPKVARITATSTDNDFWEGVESMIRRRNEDLYRSGESIGTETRRK